MNSGSRPEHIFSHVRIRVKLYQLSSAYGTLIKDTKLYALSNQKKLAPVFFEL